MRIVGALALTGSTFPLRRRSMEWKAGDLGSSEPIPGQRLRRNGQGIIHHYGTMSVIPPCHHYRRRRNDYRRNRHPFSVLMERESIDVVDLRGAHPLHRLLMKKCVDALWFSI